LRLRRTVPEAPGGRCSPKELDFLEGLNDNLRTSRGGGGSPGSALPAIVFANVNPG